MSRRVRRLIDRWNILWLAAGLGGCAVVGSAPTFIDEPGLAFRCESTLGSYSLPKTVLNLRITQEVGTTNYYLQEITGAPVPDNQHTFCLDHLRSPLASDEVRVFKNKITTQLTDTGETVGTTKLSKRSVTGIEPASTPFLQLVASKAVDHTAGIIRRVIRAAFLLLSNKGSAGRSSVGVISDATQTPKQVVVADFQVDPFDYQEMARINESVRKYGFCIVLEDYTFDRSGTGIDRYCRTPQLTSAERPPVTAEGIQRLHYLVQKPVAGIFFRPRAAYRLSVYIKNDPDGRGSWRLGHIKNLQMENIMPIVSVGIGRAVFATRRTGLVFDDGALTNVCISKGSEIEGAIQIPLDVIYGIVALPSDMLLAAINDADTTKQLLAAQKRLIGAQNQYIKYLNNDQGSFTQISQTDDQKNTVGGKLTLGSTASDAFPADEPPDAGPIYSSSGGDALADICAELSLTKTLNPGQKTTTGAAGTPAAGSF